jgi:hypothetical protein
MVCDVARSNKSFRERPSPPYPAADCPTDAVRRGNDGRMWRAAESGKRKCWVRAAGNAPTNRAAVGNVLPDDVMREIGKRVSPTTLVRLAAVNRQRRAALAETPGRSLRSCTASCWPP